MRFLLINPRWEGLIGHDRRFNRPWPPLSLLNCAAILKGAGHEVNLLDGRAKRMNEKELGEESNRSDYILLTSSPIDRWQCPNLDLRPFFSFSRHFPREKLVICGVHGTIYPEKILHLTQADFLVRGEPEASVGDFVAKGSWEDTLGVSYLRKGKIEHNPQCPPLNLDSLPLPAYDLIDPRDYHYEILGGRTALLEGGRGCPYRCPFCLKIMYGPEVRMKPIPRVIEEIEYVIKENGFRTVYFIDLEFAFDRKRVLNLCYDILKKNLNFFWACQTRVDSVDEELLCLMSQAGCRLIHLGIETGQQTTQKWIKKEIDLEQAKQIIHQAYRVGIATACFYLVGFPHENPQDRKETFKLAKSLNSTYASFHELAPYPATTVFDLAFDPGEFFPARLPDSASREIQSWIKRALLRYYLRPRHWIKGFRHFLFQGLLLKKFRLFKEFIC